MKRVLVITYYWPPSGGSGVQRWVKFSKYLPAESWQSVIYTPSNPSVPSVDSSLERDIPEEVVVIRRPIREIYSLYRRLNGKNAKEEINPINQRKKSLKQRLFMALRGNLFIPDPRISWVRPSVKFLEEYLKNHPVDIIVSTGPPHSMHLIAKRLATKTGLPWIADFRDPWTKMFYFKHLQLLPFAKKRHAKLEQSVLDSCDRVVAVSPLVQKEFQSMTDTPVELITNGYDPEDYKETVRADRFFNIVHTGLFAADGDPDVLWRALAEKCADNASFAEKLKIRLVGKTDREIHESIERAGLGKYVTDRGYQPHIEAVKEQLGASILILPLRKEPEYRATLPGKIFEYLASRKPVLGIGQSDGAMAALIEQTHSGEVFDWEDKVAIASFVDRCWELYLSGENWNNTDNIEQYSRTATTAKMAALMKSLT